jgi:hypothetical protein
MFDQNELDLSKLKLRALKNRRSELDLIYDSMIKEANSLDTDSEKLRHLQKALNTLRTGTEHLHLRHGALL